MAAPGITVAVDGRGRTTPLGDYVFGLLADRGTPVSELARTSGLSRSFLYLLKDDRQVPSLDTLVALFEALGADDVRLAGPDEPGELRVVVGGRTRWIRLPGGNRQAERSRAAAAALAPSSSPEAPMRAAQAAPPAAMPAPVAAMAPPPPAAPRRSAAPAAYGRSASGGFVADEPDPRQRRLAELLAAAGALDEERLDLLVEHARLLGRG